VPSRPWHGVCPSDPVEFLDTRGAMVPILMWLLGVPIGLILILMLLGVVHF
jgi:hypothetical protein